MNRTFVWVVCAPIFGVLSSIAACGGGSSSSGSVAGANGQSQAEVINGVSVPPAPDVAKNAATVAGVDSDNNGVRDDVDRYLARKFGGVKSDYLFALTFAKTLQAALILPSPAAAKVHIDHLRCVADENKLLSLDETSKMLLDTQARRRAYVDAFAGVVINSVGCRS